MKKRFALVGAAGYIAERHMKAIKETENEIVIAFDLFDVMGKIDSYFPKAEFVNDEQSFYKFIKQQNKTNLPIDYITICTPNHTHSKYICKSIISGCNVICEKPITHKFSELQQIQTIEKKYNKKVNTILQLRHHPKIIDLKNKIEQTPNLKRQINLTYITTRGPWYYKTWKADINKSGGIIMNIGIHFFDMLIWLFGYPENYILKSYSHNKAAGKLIFKNAIVNWFLSLDQNDLPPNHPTTYREIIINDEKINFTNGFTNLHTTTYQHILNNNGFTINQILPSIKLINEITPKS